MPGRSRFPQALQSDMRDRSAGQRIMDDSRGNYVTSAQPESVNANPRVATPALRYRLLAAALIGLGLRGLISGDLTFPKRLPAMRVQHGMLGLTCVLLAGCSPIAEKLGLRVRLDAVLVTAVSAHLTAGRDHS